MPSLSSAGGCCRWADTAPAPWDVPRAGWAARPHHPREARARCGARAEISPVNVPGPRQAKGFGVQKRRVLPQHPLACSHRVRVGLHSPGWSLPGCSACLLCVCFWPRSKDGEMAPELRFPASCLIVCCSAPAHSLRRAFAASAPHRSRHWGCPMEHTGVPSPALSPLLCPHRCLQDAYATPLPITFTKAWR